VEEFGIARAKNTNSRGTRELYIRCVYVTFNPQSFPAAQQQLLYY